MVPRSLSPVKLCECMHVRKEKQWANMRIWIFWRQDPQLSSDPEGSVSPRPQSITEVSANTVPLPWCHQAQEAGWGGQANTSAVCSWSSSPETICHDSALHITHHLLSDLVTSLFPTEWNLTQRWEGWTGRHPKDLATQVTPGCFLGPFYLWGSILTHGLSLKTGLLFHCDLSLTTESAYGPPHVPYLWVW